MPTTSERFCKEHRWSRLVDAIELGLQQNLGVEFVVRSSLGCGGWARVPWVAVSVPTETTQHGLYVQLLCAADMSGVWLCLGQGTTKLEKAYGKAAATAQLQRVGGFVREVCASALPASLGFSLQPRVDLKDKGGLASSYERAAVVAKHYATSDLPPEATFLSELRGLLVAYRAVLREPRYEEVRQARRRGGAPSHHPLHPPFLSPLAPTLPTIPCRCASPSPRRRSSTRAPSC